MKSKNFFIFLFLAPLIGICLGTMQIYYGITVWGYSGKKIIFTIKKGENFGRINHRLNEKKIIYGSRIFYHYTKFKNKINDFKAGSYYISPNITMPEVLLLVTTGKGITTRITIPEGKNIFEISKILEENSITKSKDFITNATDPEFIKSLGIPSHRAEGYLYPDTYHFEKNTPAKDIIKRMFHLFKKKTQFIDFKSSRLNKHQVITLASIVEKETGAKFERKTIAGVFLNRLKKKMRLQSDPTTIYGIFPSYDGNLKKRDLYQKNKYNTYKIQGLPIGPISNPGKEAMEATLFPQVHQYLYFVSKNNGTHIFTKNYKEHRKAVKKWQKNIKNREGKSWRNLKE